MHSFDQTVWDGMLYSNVLSFQILNTSNILINELYLNTYNHLQWVELYNPTSISIDINGWIIDFYMPIYVTKINQEAIIGPNQFIIICNDQTTLTAFWNLSDTIIIEYDFFGFMIGGEEVSISNNLGIVDYVDYSGPPSGAPLVPANHSIARYKGGYDTDNSSQDFYNESSPTPGSENTRLKSEEPEPILEFTSSLDKQKYVVDEPIYITSTLTNIGTISVYMNKFALELNTIDFYISTPEGYDISHRPSVFGEDILVKLDPGASINYTVDFTEPVWNFGNLDGIDHYNFTILGNYTIRSVYTSALFSNLLYFEIIDDTLNNRGEGSGSTNGNGDGDGWLKLTTTYAPGLAIVAICIIISISLVAGTEVGKYGFFVAVSPLYTRLNRDDIVQQENRWQIIGFIKGKPGATYGEIKRKLGIGNGTLAYHLKVLEREEFIKSKNRGRFKCFYAIEERIPHEEVKLSNIQKQILDTVRANPGISQKKIIILSGKTQQVISYHLGILLRESLIAKKKKGRVMSYFPEEDNELENN
jgi:predicted transcriptional regulator